MVARLCAVRRTEACANHARGPHAHCDSYLCPRGALRTLNNGGLQRLAHCPQHLSPRAWQLATTCCTAHTDSLTHRPALSGVREDARAISPAHGVAAASPGNGRSLQTQPQTPGPGSHTPPSAQPSPWARWEELRGAFRRADGDGDGRVRWPEFRAALAEVCGRHHVALGDQDAERVGDPGKGVLRAFASTSKERAKGPHAGWAVGPSRR